MFYGHLQKMVLKPFVQIEPVKVDGVTILEFNAKFIEDNMMGLGAIIRIIRSGHVIPHIEEVIEKASIPLMPKEDYEWNDTHVDIILKNKRKMKSEFKNYIRLL